jgi:hypothetical protein
MTFTLDLTDGNKSIDEMGNLELKGWIVNKLNRVESQISHIISGYFNPEKKDEFINIVCHNSILNFGAKIKVLNNIPGFSKNIANKLSVLSSIRNGFAHKIEIKGLNLIFDKEQKNVKEIKPGDDQIEVMNSQGEIKKKNFKVYAKEFKNILTEVIPYISTFNQHSLKDD